MEGRWQVKLQSQVEMGLNRIGPVSRTRLTNEFADAPIGNCLSPGFAGPSILKVVLENGRLSGIFAVRLPLGPGNHDSQDGLHAVESASYPNSENAALSGECYVGASRVGELSTRDGLPSGAAQRRVRHEENEEQKGKTKNVIPIS